MSHRVDNAIWEGSLVLGLIAKFEVKSGDTKARAGKDTRKTLRIVYGGGWCET